MAIYDKPTKALMADWAGNNLRPGMIFSKAQPVAWFRANFPAIKTNTVEMHVEGMSINNSSRKHHPSIKSGSGHDLFYKEGPGRFRLWNKENDPAPRYKTELDATDTASATDREMCDDEERAAIAGGDTFAYERDLQNYLARNLHQLENGLKLYEEEGLTGIEFNAGGRFIDILAVDAAGSLVVVELKVSRGYDRVIGQILRYMGWVEAHLSEGKPVRGMIVASAITQDLVLATSHIADRVKLFEYAIAFTINQKDRLGEH